MCRCTVWKAHYFFNGAIELQCPIAFLSQFTEREGDAETRRNSRHCGCAVHTCAETHACGEVFCLTLRRPLRVRGKHHDRCFASPSFASRTHQVVLLVSVGWNLGGEGGFHGLWLGEAEGDSQTFLAVLLGTQCLTQNSCFFCASINFTSVARLCCLTCTCTTVASRHQVCSFVVDRARRKDANTTDNTEKHTNSDRDIREGRDRHGDGDNDQRRDSLKGCLRVGPLPLSPLSPSTTRTCTESVKTKHTHKHRQ